MTLYIRAKYNSTIFTRPLLRPRKLLVELYCETQLEILETLSNEDGNANDDGSEKSLSRCNFSENSVQALSSVHFNVQLLYLLLFFAVVVGVLVA